ncbi:hypothetical protein LC087_17520 [Bacillus carboniphilus]|uniref:Uncharacterized protein n=1 Tax=Bacillus carboniphilus TaxID=86663 RepID=A0ABY9JSV4_9BACI|nr:hypothetical protein [Bacillus carboniphilus]WLR42472.1 hypothetical protein LC087_17520 [Bacillus carboniphilus]
MSILFTTGPIDNTKLDLSNIEVRIRNTDPSNNASVTIRFFNESLSPESLIDSDSFTIGPNSTESELYSAALLTSFLVEVEVSLTKRSDKTTATAVQPTITVLDDTNELVQFIRLLVSNPKNLQNIDYPMTPQLNLFLPNTINCKSQIKGDVSIEGSSPSGC